MHQPRIVLGRLREQNGGTTGALPTSDADEISIAMTVRVTALESNQ